MSTEKVQHEYGADEIQTIITCTGLDEFVKNRFQINKVFYVKNGTIEVEER